MSIECSFLERARHCVSPRGRDERVGVSWQGVPRFAFSRGIPPDPDPRRDTPLKIRTDHQPPTTPVRSGHLAPCAGHEHPLLMTGSGSCGTMRASLERHGGGT